MAENTELKAFADATKSLKAATKNIGEKDGVFGAALKENFKTGFKSLSGPFAAMLGPAQMLAKITMVKQIKDWALKKRRNAREEKLLRDQLGLSKEEYKDLEQKKKIADANKKWADSLGSAAENLLGADAARVKELIEIKEGILGGNKDQQEQNQTANDNAKKQTMGGARQAEKDKEAEMQRRKEITLFQQMADGIKGMHQAFLDSIKKGAKMGLGIILALIAAPIIALVAFFKQLALEFTFLKALTGKGLTKLFAPLKKLFTGKGPIGKAFTSLNKTIKGIGTSIKGSKAFVAVGKVGTKIKGAITSLGKFFAPMIKFFKAVFGLGKSLISTSKLATTIVSFAKGFGRILGKIFLPITILMSAFDFITGFMKGYEEGGILGGLEMGLSKMFKGLIGMPLDLLKSAASWILGKFGFENAEKALDAFSFSDLIGDIISGIFGMIKSAVDWIKKLFTDPVGALKELWTNLVGAGDWIVNAIGGALDSVWEWFKGLFNIDFTTIAKAIVPDWAPDFIKEAVGIPVKKKTVAELEGELKQKEIAATSGMGNETTKKDIAEMKALREEIETLKRQNQATAAGGSVNVSAPTNVKNEKTSVSTAMLTKANPLVVAVAGAGWE